MRRRSAGGTLGAVVATVPTSRAEVVQVALQTPTRQDVRWPSEEVPAGQGPPSLRALAIERIYRIRRLKVHLVAFAFGLPALAVVWVLTEYYEEHTWPSRFASDPDVAGTWDPWFFFVAGLWPLYLVIKALRAYFGPPVGPIGRYVRRPIPEEELERTEERLASGRFSFVPATHRQPGRVVR